MPSGTDTMFFIPVTAIPKDKKGTYLCIVAAYCPEKENLCRIHFTCGGDRIIYLGDVSTKTADLATVKIHPNSVISTPCARYMTANLKDFYLNTPMDSFEYMHVPIDIIPDSIMDEYKLHDHIHNGYVYVEI
jgi:hypothetical protein